MLFYAEEKNEVFVVSIQRETTRPNSLNMWIVSDNLHKGGATNAVQTAGYLIRQHLA